MIQLDFDNIYSEPICLALGYFDSVHCGHREIIEQLKSVALRHHAQSAVFTFDNNMDLLFSAQAKQVYTYIERIRILESLGVDTVIHKSFDSDFMSVDAQRFLDALFERFIIKAIVCGYDYRFGNGGKGNVSLLEAVCKEKGIMLTVVPKIDMQGNRVSTTRIKKALESGKIEEANCLLGQPFSVDGKVVRGRGEGHIYGFPTANIAVSKDKQLPSLGVYGTYAYLSGEKYKAVTNVGSKPTFGVDSVSVETLVIGLDREIYGKDLKIEFIKRLRDIEKFDSPSKLSDRIHKDTEWRC